MRHGLLSAAAAFIAAAVILLAAAAFAGEVELFQDVDTGQVYTRPGENRVPLSGGETEAVRSVMPSLYQDPETGAVYAKPGEGRIPVASSARTETAAATAPAAEPTSAPADYSSEAFAAAVKNVIGEEGPQSYPRVKLGAEAYVGYLYDFDDEVAGEHSRNKFSLNRGYINIKGELTDKVRFRITPDISRVSDRKYVTDVQANKDVLGNISSITTKTSSAPNAGDYELRLKYYYVDFHDFLAAYPSLSVKLGQFEGAWLDHVEHLWTYRVQGTMMVEREGFMNSANLGVNLQGKLPSGYGEWQANFVNGEGYHSDEKNKYKSVQARLTLHPLPGNEWTKGLELTGFTFLGKEDSSHKRDRTIAFVGYHHEKDFFIGAEYLWTRGRDKFVAPTGVNNVKGGGLSVLGWVRMPFYEPIRLMARWDHFDHDLDSPNNTDNRYIWGVSYDINKYLTLLFDHERTVTKSHKDGYTSAYADENLFKADLLLKF